MPFWDHLRELGNRLRKVFFTWIGVIVFLMAVPASITEVFSGAQVFTGVYRPLIAGILTFIRDYILNSPLTGNVKVTPILGAITAALELYLLGAFWLSIIIISPFLTYEIYKFVEPALYENERLILRKYGFWFIFLFLFGSLLGFFIISPIIIRTFVIFATWFGAEPVVFIVDIYSTVFMTTIFTGFAFTLPLIILVLIKLGVVSTKWIERNRFIFYVILFIISAIITPDGGLVANLILIGPIIVMTEIVLRVGKKYERERGIT